MDFSVKLQVRKRDGSIEAFDRARLASVIAAAAVKTGGSWHEANDLAEAIELYLRRSNQNLTSSAAVFEMVVKSLNRIGLTGASQRLELNARLRSMGRRLLRVSYDSSRNTLWDKSWLAEIAQRSWGLSWRTARILAAEVETDIIVRGMSKVTRNEVVDMLNTKVSQFGLGDAVPVDQFAAKLEMEN